MSEDACQFFFPLKNAQPHLTSGIYVAFVEAKEKKGRKRMSGRCLTQRGVGGQLWWERQEMSAVKT